MSAPAPGGYHTSEDERILHKLGYAQELFRAMGGFQNFAISFTIISILAGCLTSYYIAFEQRRPDRGHVGLAARRPHEHDHRPRDGRDRLGVSRRPAASTTGRRSSGSPAWGWFTGWFNLIGQIAVTAAIGYGLAIFGTALLNFWFDYSEHEGMVGASSTSSTSVRDLPDRCVLHQPAQRAHHRAAEHDLGLLAHGRASRSSCAC